MTPFDRLDAIAAPLPIANIDTDKIVPGRFLKTITRQGLGAALFWSLRQDPQFVLNREPWNNAKILIALDNFGCGSSREHAPWALLDFGIRCVIAPSIADIFYNNCLKNGILPIVLPTPDVEILLKLASDPLTAVMVIDLPAQNVVPCSGSQIHFEIDAKRKQDLLAGIDEIARTIGYDQAITAYESRGKVDRSWLDAIDLDG